jgi:16S rRNA G966 N2-methylase RsmD
MKSEDRFRRLAEPEVIKFINDNTNTSIPDLVLKGSPFEFIDINLLVNQIVGKKKARKKLPTWFKSDQIIYPPKLNLEQTSSEITASHKSKFIDGSTMIDLTGGFGVDDYYFSNKVEKLIYSELNTSLFEIAKHNFNVFGINNIKCYNQDSIMLLEKANEKFDWIYVDPSRRNKNQKVFLLKDSLPNLLEFQKLLRKKSHKMMIKTSPMYDIEMGYKELSGIQELHIVSVKNEVKELLWIIDWRSTNSRVIKLYNYNSDKEYSYIKSKGRYLNNSQVKISNCQEYLYEFNSSIMKSGIYDQLAVKYHLFKLECNTNLYTSKELIKSFPGKIYKVNCVNPINFKGLKKEYKNKPINVICKNLKLTTSAIQKKLGFKTGTDLDYLIFAKTTEGNRVIEAVRL